MKIRVYTVNNYIDIEASPETTKEGIEECLSRGDTVAINTLDNTIIYLNCINIVAIEVLNTAPIQEK